MLNTVTSLFTESDILVLQMELKMHKLS